jgi:hypothetical protein
MRALTRKQKRLLKEEFERLQKSGIEYPRDTDIDPRVYHVIWNIHPCEINHVLIQHYFTDELGGGI